MDETGVPVALGILTTDSLDKALARAGGAVGNKGEECVLHLLETLDVMEKISAGSTRGIRKVRSWFEATRQGISLQMLFQLDLGQTALQTWNSPFCRSQRTRSRKTACAPIGEDTWEKVADLDGRLRAFAQHWDLARMAAVDRNVLRLAAYEILYDPQVPKSVAINEALEIVKRFSTEESSRFVKRRLGPA